MIKSISTLFFLFLVTNTFCQKTVKPIEILYTMPAESSLHEGTWLQWPHQYQYGLPYCIKLNNTWIDITKALSANEKVHIIVYNESEKVKVLKMLEYENINTKNIDFSIYPTDDFWVRDNGPIFVKDKNYKLVIQDWGFNAWGKNAKYGFCNQIPSKIAKDKNIEIVDLNNQLILEGGAVEIDGDGTLMATKSAILNANRNPKINQIQLEELLTKYFGVTNFVWLTGVKKLEITDMHIDGFARFVNSQTIITMSKNDLEYWDVPKDDINILFTARNKNNKSYRRVFLPLTKETVTTDYGRKLAYKASYLNFYVANKVVLVPNYNDQNDEIANAIIQKQYPDRKVIGIDSRNLYANGGMIHCITQQQPAK